MSSVQSVTQHRSAPTPQIIPSGKGCGAEVTGVSLAMLDSSTVTTLQQAVLDHLVVVVRGQPISDPQLLALGRSFGPLEPPGMSIIGKPYIDEYPDILVISNLMANGQPMGNLGAGEAIWHTDMSTAPSLARLRSCMRWKCRRPEATPISPTSIWRMKLCRPT